jgi:putative transposase
MFQRLPTDLSGLDLLVVQIDGIHIAEHLVLVAAVGIDGVGIKHPLGLMEGQLQRRAVFR